MRPLPSPHLIRFGAARLPLAMEAYLARRGGRAFAPRAERGDVAVTLPEAGGPQTILVPRGYGNPMPARHLGGELRAEPTGALCSPARWVPTGGIAAWLRPVPTPRGPAAALRPPVADTAGEGPWLCVRPVSLDWSAARLIHPSAGHGPVAVVDRWVRAVSPAARARGVSRGMSAALAARTCPGLTLLPRPATPLGAAVEERLTAWFGPVRRQGGALLLRLPTAGGAGTDSLAQAERTARLLWQELGVEVRAAVATDERAAMKLSGWLEPGWVALASADGEAAWTARAPRVSRLTTARLRAHWQGPAAPDLEGAVTRARVLAEGLLGAARGNILRVELRGERGTRRMRARVPQGCGRVGIARMVEGIVRREGATAGAISGLTLTVLPSAAETRPRRRPNIVSPPCVSADPVGAGPLESDLVCGSLLPAPAKPARPATRAERSPRRTAADRSNERRPRGGALAAAQPEIQLALLPPVR